MAGEKAVGVAGSLQHELWERATDGHDARRMQASLLPHRGAGPREILETYIHPVKKTPCNPAMEMHTPRTPHDLCYGIHTSLPGSWPQLVAAN